MIEKATGRTDILGKFNEIIDEVNALITQVTNNSAEIASLRAAIERLTHLDPIQPQQIPNSHD